MAVDVVDEKLFHLGMGIAVEAIFLAFLEGSISAHAIAGGYVHHRHGSETHTTLAVSQYGFGQIINGLQYLVG